MGKMTSRYPALGTIVTLFKVSAVSIMICDIIVIAVAIETSTPEKAGEVFFGCIILLVVSAVQIFIMLAFRELLKLVLDLANEVHEIRGAAEAKKSFSAVAN